MLSPGSVVAERFLIKGELGRGGSATVYLAEDGETGGGQVALKVLHGHLGDEDVVRTRLGREVMACRRLSHPNILPVYELHSAGGLVFLSMAYHPGRNLAEVIEESGPLDVEGVRTLGMAVASALQTAHLKGVLHRDLKPQNLLIGEDGQVQLTDFGLARMGDMATVTATGQLLGTPGYVPPEVLMGQRWDPRGDIYGLGVVLYQALTGERPFQGMGALAILRAQGEGPPPPPSSLNPLVPEWLDAIVVAALSPAPADRPGGASALYGALEERRSPMSLAVVPLSRPSEAKGGGAIASMTEASPLSNRGGGPSDRTHVVFLTGRPVGKKQPRMITAEDAIHISEVLQDAGYVLPPRFEGGLIVRFRDGRGSNMPLVDDLTRSEARALCKALKQRGVGAEVDGHRLGPLHFSKYRSDSLWAFLAFIPVIAFLPLKIWLFVLSMIGLGVFHLKKPEALLEAVRGKDTPEKPTPERPVEVLAPSPTLPPVRAKPASAAQSLKGRVGALGAENRDKAKRVLRGLTQDTVLPEVALGDLKLRVNEVVKTTEGLERGALALSELLEEMDEPALWRRLGTLEQRGKRHFATEGVADPELKAAIQAQRERIHQLQTIEADIGRHMAQLMTLGASLDSIALLTAQARIAKDMDLMEGVSRVVSRLEGDVASAGQILQVGESEIG